MSGIILKTDGTFVERPLKTLEDLQWAVGGNIELIPYTYEPSDDDDDDDDMKISADLVECYCNENGRTLSLPINPWTCFLTREGFFCWRMIRGDVAVTGADEGFMTRVRGFDFNLSNS